LRQTFSIADDVSRIAPKQTQIGEVRQTQTIRSFTEKSANHIDTKNSTTYILGKGEANRQFFDLLRHWHPQLLHIRRHSSFDSSGGK